jgi:hypothetical protein
VAVQHVALEAVADTYGDAKLARVVERLELERSVEVALRERSVLEQLAVAVAVAVRRLNLAGVWKQTQNCSDPASNSQRCVVPRGMTT